MSNHLAIATVTATLCRVIQAGVQSIYGTAPIITTLQPLPGSGTPEVGINLFLYQVTPNSASNNSDLNLRRPKNDLIRRGQIGLDLNYLLTFYGDEKRLEAQILMGSAVKTLVDYPFLYHSMFRQTLADPNFSYLAESTLPEQNERVRLTPLSLKPDEMARIWNTMPQANAPLSIAYQATFILIEGNEMGDAPMPIRDLRTFVNQGQPSVERVIHVGKSQRAPVTLKSALNIIGKGLKGYDTQVRIGPATAAPTPQHVSESLIHLNLSSFSTDKLRAGVQSLQIIHMPPADRELEPNRFQEPDFAIESNAIAFVLCPTIMGEPQVEAWDINQQLLPDQNVQLSATDPRQGEIKVELNVNVDPTQRILLIMNKMINPGEPSSLISFIYRAKNMNMTSSTVSFVYQNLQVGEYLIRVQVDGAESEFIVDEDPKSPTFDQVLGPKVVIY
jgi:Pvc16 N-terminal domain